MTKLLFSLLLLLASMSAHAQVDGITGASSQVSQPKQKKADKVAVATDTLQSAQPRSRVKLETSKGDIIVELYNETPLHRDNFIRLVKSGYYDGILWHRVIKEFVIQTGDSTTRHAEPGATVGEYDLDYTLPAEIRFPQYFHKRGALAAARESDDVNPERRSSAAQFYIVWGFTYGTNGLAKAQERIDANTNGTAELTPEIKETYRNLGGTASLDGAYTVFGEVVEGLDKVWEIDKVETDDYDRPIDDVRIVRATLLE